MQMCTTVLFFASPFWKIVEEKPLELSAGCKETGDLGILNKWAVDSGEFHGESTSSAWWRFFGRCLFCIVKPLNARQ